MAIGVLCNLIWSFHSVFSKTLLQRVSPLEVSVLRYGTALLTLALILFTRRARAQARLRRSEVIPALWIGFFGFFMAPLLHLIGLATARASESSIIIAMEPLATLLLGWLFLRERLAIRQGLGLGIAFLGFLLMAVNSTDATAGISLDVGQVLILLSMFGEGMYTVIGRKIGHSSADPSWTLFLALVAGMALQSTAWQFFPEIAWTHFLHALGGFSWKQWAAVLWLGPLGTTLGYFLWLIALKRTPVSVMALTLFIQPVVGAALGAWILGERLGGRQIFGALLIFSAVAAQAIASARKKSLAG